MIAKVMAISVQKKTEATAFIPRSEKVAHLAPLKDVNFTGPDFNLSFEI
jgi:hypothetical protein